MKIVDFFEASGLTRRAWCEAMGISDSRWAQIRSGIAKVPEKLLIRAEKVAQEGAAIRSGEIDLRASAKLAEIRKILE